MSQEKKPEPNEKLKAAREQGGYSQKALAEKLGGVDSSTVSDWENGKHWPSGYYQEKLIKILEVGAEDLGFTQKRPRRTRKKALDFPSLENGEAVISPVIEKDNLDQPVKLAPIHEELPERAYSQQYSSTEKAFFQHWQSTGLSGKVPKFLLACILGSLFLVVVGYALFPLYKGIVGQILQPPSTQSPTTIQVQDCPSNVTDYVVVHTAQKDYCFSGSESMSFDRDGVISITTNNDIASWKYLRGNKEQRDPDNFDLKLHVCKHLVVTYSTPIHLTRMFIASPSKKARCTNNVPNATPSA